MPQKKQLFIAYFYKKEIEEKDTEIYVGSTGKETEFRNYWKKQYNQIIEENDIIDIYPLNTAVGIDGKFYNIGIIK